MSRRVHFVALGCPKNRVDTERMAGLARRLGLELTGDPGQADLIVVNTCGFILPAKEESIETVLELAQLKEHGPCRALVMAGCLPQRHAQELAAQMPEVDHFIGTEDLPRLAEILVGGTAPRLCVSPPGAGPLLDAQYERELTDSPHSTYLKIAEGCDRRCAFCVIPRIRGHQRSRTVASLLEEAAQLARWGVRELSLVAQDSTAYGRDLSPPSTLADLLAHLAQIDQLCWIRVLYAYPTAVDLPLIQALADLPRVVPYLDLPIQHVDDAVLRAMRRGHDGAQIRRLLDDLRRDLPGIFIRTTLISGHPGETAQAHRALLDFVAGAELDHVGVFPFFAEEGTAAAEMSDQVPADVATERADEVLALQRGISRRRLARLRGAELSVMVDGVSPQSEYLLQGRHPGQAPDVDGVVILTDCAGELEPGDLVRARVTDSGDHDLVATPLL